MHNQPNYEKNLIDKENILDIIQIKFQLIKTNIIFFFNCLTQFFLILADMTRNQI